MKLLLRQTLTTLSLLILGCVTVWADDFTVERAVNLGSTGDWYLSHVFGYSR